MALLLRGGGYRKGGEGGEEGEGRWKGRRRGRVSEGRKGGEGPDMCLQVFLRITYDSTSIRRTFDCISKVIKVTVT